MIIFLADLVLSFKVSVEAYLDLKLYFRQYSCRYLLKTAVSVQVHLRFCFTCIVRRNITQVF